MDRKILAIVSLRKKLLWAGAKFRQIHFSKFKKVIRPYNKAPRAMKWKYSDLIHHYCDSARSNVTLSPNPILSSNEDQGDMRIDHNVGDKDKIFFAADYSHILYSIPSVLPNFAVGQTFGQAQSYPAYARAVGYDHVFNPMLVNEFHFGYHHFIENVRSIYGNSQGIPAQFGIGGIPQVPNNGGLPPIGVSGLTHIGVGNFTPTLETSPRWKSWTMSPRFMPITFLRPAFSWTASKATSRNLPAAVATSTLAASIPTL